MMATLLRTPAIPLLAVSLAIVGCTDISSVPAVNLAAADTLPHDNADPRVGFTISRSAVYSGDTIRVQFTYTNGAADSIGMWSSGSCLFDLNTFTVSGVRVAPVDRTCTADFREWVLGPGGQLTISQTWRADNGQSVNPPGPTNLPPGIYTLVPSIFFNQTKPNVVPSTSNPAPPVSVIGGSLRIQVFRRP